MGRSVLLCVLCVLLVVASGRGDSPCRAPSSPVCYKPSRRPDEDFTCEWTSEDDMRGFSYTLHLRNETEGVDEDFRAGEKQSYKLIYDFGRLSINIQLQIWVVAQRDNIMCYSANTSVQLDQAVKYPAPKLKTMSRSSDLFLEWDKPEDQKGADYEIRYKESRDSFRTIHFNTEDGKPHSYTMNSVDRSGTYEFNVRRKAKEVKYAQWSSWSSPVYVPVRLQEPPVVTVTVMLNKKQNARRLKLSWKPPSAEASVGGVMYHLSLSTWPCDTAPWTWSTNLTVFSTTITFSEARVSIYAQNNAGRSPSRNLTVPPKQDLGHTTAEWSKVLEGNKKRKLKRMCWEWYPLGDGQTRPRPAEVKNDTGRTEANITQIADMKDFVRYYYFVHLRESMTQMNPRTLHSCPVYKRESTPLVEPQNLTVKVNATSLKVCWQPIPVPMQRGFLTHYRICLSEDCKNVPESQTCKTFQDLKPGSEYSISVAGETRIGPGPSAMENIWTEGARQTGSRQYWIAVGCLLGLSLLAACPLLFFRLRNKLPAVPKPVIAISVKYSPSSQEVHSPREEVHMATLEHVQKTPETLCSTPQERHTLLKREAVGNECEDRHLDEEEKEEEKREEDDVMTVTDEYDVAPNPNYKQQTLGIPEVMETILRECDVTSPVYKNGLFFDVKLESCENMGSSV